jgi:hypothetical protein
MMRENCNTNCRISNHMIQCPICGIKYHIGLIHYCPTGATYY